MQKLFFYSRVCQMWVSSTAALHIIGADLPAFVRLHCKYWLQLLGLLLSFEKPRKKDNVTSRKDSVMPSKTRESLLSFHFYTDLLSSLSVLLCLLWDSPLFIIACQTFVTFSHIRCYLKHLINLMPKKWLEQKNKAIEVLFFFN